MAHVFSSKGKNYIYHIERGFILPVSVRLIGAILLLLFMLALTDEKQWLSVIIWLPIGFTLNFLKEGVLVNIHKSSIKDYWGFPFLRLGRWRNYGEIEMIGIQPKGRAKRSLPTGTFWMGKTSNSTYYRVYIVNQKFRQYRVGDFDQGEAEAQARKLAQLLGTKVVRSWEVPGNVY